MKYLCEEKATERDMLIFGKKLEKKDYLGGCKHFDKMSVDTALLLILKSLLNPNERQNSSPTVQEMVDFMVKYPNFTAHGYVVSPERSDVRVSFEGISSDVPLETNEEIMDFMHLFRFADDFRINPPYVWYD